MASQLILQRNGVADAGRSSWGVRMYPNVDGSLEIEPTPRAMDVMGRQGGVGLSSLQNCIKPHCSIRRREREAACAGQDANPTSNQSSRLDVSEGVIHSEALGFFRD